MQQGEPVVRQPGVGAIVRGAFGQPEFRPLPAQQAGLVPAGECVDHCRGLRHGGFGRWEFLEITDPWNAENAIRAFLARV